MCPLPGVRSPIDIGALGFEGLYPAVFMATVDCTVAFTLP